MTRKLMLLAMGLILVLSLALTSCGTAAEQKPADFYQGKNIDWVSCTEPGAAAYSIAQLYSTYLQKVTGATGVITVRRGAGGTEGPMYVYNGKPDGLTMGSWVITPMALQKIMAVPGADYDMAKYTYLGSVDLSPQVFFVATKGRFQSVADIKAGKDLKLAGTSIDGNFTLGSMTVAYVLGLDAKVVTGYKGVADVVLSMEQGETVGMIMPVAAAMPSYKAGRIKPLFYIHTKRSDVFPDVPTLMELAPVTGDKQALLEAWDGLYQSFHTFSSPGIPADKATYLQESFSKIMADPEFQKEIDKISGYHVTTYLSGKDLTNMAEKVMKASATSKATFDMLTKQYAAVKR